MEDSRKKAGWAKFYYKVLAKPMATDLVHRDCINR